MESSPAPTVYNQTDAVCGFLLDALTGDDGRVRQSANCALKVASGLKKHLMKNRWLRV